MLVSHSQRGQRGRPIADFGHCPAMLRCGPSNLPFAALAKYRTTRTYHLRKSVLSLRLLQRPLSREHNVFEHSFELVMN